MSEKTLTENHAAPAASAQPTVPLTRGLSTKLLLLTIAFVLLAEILIFLPWMANYRMSWLRERLNTAAAVSVVLLQGDTATLSRAAQNDVLMAIGAKAIAVRDEGASRLLVVADMPPQVDEHIDGGDGDLVVVALRRVRGVEELAQRRQVAGAERGDGLEHAGVLGDDVAGAPIQRPG